MKIVINAVSAKLGGAVSYLANLLQHLPPPGSGYRFFVFLPSETAKLLPEVCGDIELCPLDGKNSSGWRRLCWEQITLRRFLRGEKVDLLFSTANFAMLRCPVRQILLVRNALYFSKIYQQMFLGRHRLRHRLAFAFRRWMILRSVRSADVVITPTQAMLDDLAQFVKLDRRKAFVNHYGATPPSRPEPPPPRVPQPSLPWGGGWATPGVFSSRGGPGEGVAPSPHAVSPSGPGEGVPREPFAADNNPAQDTGDSPAEAQVIRLLYVSLYSEHKNLNTLLKAMPLLHRNGAGKFLLKTTVDPRWEGAAWTVTHKDDLIQAQRPEVAPWVEFLGPLTSPQIQRLYEDADLFVFASFCESFGQPMVEAMVHGLPIVAADTPVNREMCGEAAVYFSPLDPKDLAEKIDLLGRDPALREKLRAVGERHAAAHFRWECHVDRLLKAVQQRPSSM